MFTERTEDESVFELHDDELETVHTPQTLFDDLTTPSVSDFAMVRKYKFRKYFRDQSLWLRQSY